MRRSSVFFLLLLLCGCSEAEPGSALSPGSPGEGDWVPFHTRTSGGPPRNYFYDRSQIVRTGDRLAGRWKILSPGDGTTTLYVIDIECGEGTFSERGTVQIDAEGRSRELPRSELLVDRPIEANTSSDEFRHMFCR